MCPQSVKRKSWTPEQALASLMRLCARAEKSSSDALRLMSGRGLSEADREKVLRKLVDERFIDDSRYAEAFVRDKMRYSKWGPRKIEQALWQKRIDDDTIGEALDAIDPDEYTAILKPILQQKRRTTTAKSPYELQQKLVRYALGRGFTFEQIRRCLDLGECEDCETD